MAKTSRRSASTLSVLVVDDFPDGLEMVADYLRFRGFDVNVATSGAHAIEVARAVRPDVVLMDLLMPDIDGWQATRTLKTDPRTKGICVIAATAHALRAEIESAMKAGCDGVISKPFDLVALANALPRVRTNCQKALNVPGLALPWTAQQQSRAPSRERHREHSEKHGLDQ
jgi:CheY-like chemotaxis protein